MNYNKHFLYFPFHPLVLGEMSANDVVCSILGLNNLNVVTVITGSAML
jgi:hypothetical protein